MADSHLPSEDEKPKSEVWNFSPAIVEAGFKLELESRVPNSDWLENGGTASRVESFPSSRAFE